MATITVEIINEKAYRLLEDLADLEMIRILQLVTDLPVDELRTPRFGFAQHMIGQIADDFNEPLAEFAEYQP